LSAMLNFGLKKMWLHTPVLVGTETQKIEFNIPQIASFLWRGGLNLVGVNRGPGYLSIEDFFDSSWWMRGISLGAAVLSCLLLATVAAQSIFRRSRRRAAVPTLAFYALTILVLLLAASVTFRQEFRWLYSAYIVFILLLAEGVRLTRGFSAWPQFAIAALVMLSLAREIYLKQRYERFYGVEAYRVANNLYSTVLNAKTPRANDEIVVRGGVADAGWIFMGTTFAQYYHLPPLEFSDGATAQNGSNQLVLEYRPSTRSFTVAQNTTVQRLDWGAMDVSALETASKTFPPIEGLATPTKTRVFPMPLDGQPTIVAVSATEFQVPAPAAAKSLRMSFSHVYPIGDGVDIEIKARTGDGPAQLFEKTVPPLPGSGEPRWREYELPLPSGVTQVEVHVFSKSGDSSADWLALRDFSFK